ncbi:DUF5330 domain-containing protein [Bauldia sp.]|uniref:DUF5330 domain-containing protein n=1 Tax=Bauldia sp. TaxID=2575872 RepID=UPI003BA94B4B
MFLIRIVFWLSIVVLLMPANPETGEAPRVTVMNAMLAARATVTDLSGFCERNPDVCVTGRAAAEVFAEKAENGARMIYRYLSDIQGNETDTPQGTLTDDDLMPTWIEPTDETAA